MPNLPQVKNPQRFGYHDGVIVPFVAILLPVFLVLIVLAVDYGVIVLGRHQLQNASDAGAIAAMTVYQEERLRADDAAEVVINRNLLLGDPIDFDTIQSVAYGTWNQDSKSFVEIPRGTNGQPIPQGANAVRVRLIRNQENDNAVQLFFAGLIGTDTANLEVESIASIDPTCSGFVGINSANISNNVRTDSYDGSFGRYSPGVNTNENGGVCSNGPVNLSSGAVVGGDVGGSSVTIAQGSNAMILGSIDESPDPLEFDPVEFPQFNDNDLIADPPPFSPDFYDPDKRNLIINNGRSLTLTEGTYHFNNLRLQGGGKLFIEGQVEIFVENELTFDNGTEANNTKQLPTDLLLNVANGPVNIQGGHRLNAIIYAPTSSVTIANDAEFAGDIIGRDLTFAGGAKLHYDESLRNEEDAPRRPPLLVF